MNLRPGLALLWPLLLCAACETPLQERLSPKFGAAVASFDAEIYASDPSPEPPPSSGALGAAAVRRYETGQVIQPLAASATDSTLSSSPTNNPTGSTATPSGATP